MDQLAEGFKPEFVSRLPLNKAPGISGAAFYYAIKKVGKDPNLVSGFGVRAWLRCPNG